MAKKATPFDDDSNGGNDNDALTDQLGMMFHGAQWKDMKERSEQRNKQKDRIVRIATALAGAAIMVILVAVIMAVVLGTALFVVWAVTAIGAL